MAASSGPVQVVAGEFAAVRVGVDMAGNGSLLWVEDLRTGRVRRFDALQLETIVWLPDGHLNDLLDPFAGRWGRAGEP